MMKKGELKTLFRALIGIILCFMLVLSVSEGAVLSGDVNSDGYVGTLDASAILNYLKYNGQAGGSFDRQAADYNSDGVVDYNDIYSILAFDIGINDAPVSSGDINGDSLIDSKDLGLLRKMIYETGVFGMAQARADLNADGKVDKNDYLLFRAYLQGLVNCPPVKDTFKILVFDGEGHTSRFNDDPSFTLADIKWYYNKAVNENLRVISEADVVIFPEFCFYLPEEPVLFKAISVDSRYENVRITSNHSVGRMILRLRSLAVSKRVNFVLGTAFLQEEGDWDVKYQGSACVVINSNGEISIKHPARSVAYNFYNKRGYKIDAAVYICSEGSGGSLPDSKPDLIVHTSHFYELCNHPFLSDIELIDILSDPDLPEIIRDLPADIMKRYTSFGFGTGFNKMQAVNAQRPDILIKTPNPRIPDAFKITGLLSSGIVAAQTWGSMVLVSSDEYFADLCVMRVDKAPLGEIGYKHNGAFWTDSGSPGYVWADVEFQRN